MKKPEKILHMINMKKDRMDAISRFGVSAIVIIPKSTKYIKLNNMKNMNHKNFADANSNPIIGYTISEKINTWIIM